MTLRFGDMISAHEASNDKLLEEQRQRLESIMLNACRPTMKVPPRSIPEPDKGGPADILPVNTTELSVTARPTSRPRHLIP